MSVNFELEQDIIRCWSVTNDIEEILSDLEDAHISFEQALDALRATQKIYELRFERCFRRFEQSSQEARDLRLRVNDLEYQVAQLNLAKSGDPKQQQKVDQ